MRNDDCDIFEDLVRLLKYVEVINLGTEQQKKKVKVRTSVETSVRERLVKLLHKHMDVFAWSYQDIPGLDTNIIEHKLPFLPKCSPVKKKLMRRRPDISIKIHEEVKRQFDA